MSDACRALVAMACLAVGCGGAAVAGPAAPEEAEPPPPPIAVALRHVEAPDDPATRSPQTRILLVQIDPDRGRATTDVGTYLGACSPVDPASGELLHARCWWGGQGVELSVRRLGDELVVSRTDGVTPVEVERVALPEGARVVPLGGH